MERLSIKEAKRRSIQMPQEVDKVNNLDQWEKLHVYMHYYVSMLELRAALAIRDKTKPKWQHLWGVPDEESKIAAYYFLWKDLKIPSFDKFISLENVEITDYGKDWKNDRRATRYHVQTHGIYDWYWKNEDKFTPYNV